MRLSKKFFKWHLLACVCFLLACTACGPRYVTSKARYDASSSYSWRSYLQILTKTHPMIFVKTYSSRREGKKVFVLHEYELGQSSIDGILAPAPAFMQSGYPMVATPTKRMSDTRREAIFESVIVSVNADISSGAIEFPYKDIVQTETFLKNNKLGPANAIVLTGGLMLAVLVILSNL